jgi:hypothetical protein
MLWRRQRTLFLPLISCAVLSGCAGSSGEAVQRAGNPTALDSSPVVSIPDAFTCAEGCGSRFTFGGANFQISCGGVKPEFITERTLGQDQQTVIREVDGVPPSLLVAINRPGGNCSLIDPDQHPTDWAIAFSIDADQQAVLSSICQVAALSAAERLADGCHRGAPDLITCGIGPAFPPDVLEDVTRFPPRTDTFGDRLEEVFVQPRPEDLDGWRVILSETQSDGELVGLMLRAADDGTIEFALSGATTSTPGPAVCVPTALAREG